MMLSTQQIALRAMFTMLRLTDASGVNLLQIYGVVSDNATNLHDIADTDCSRAIAWLSDYSERVLYDTSL